MPRPAVLFEPRGRAPFALVCLSLGLVCASARAEVNETPTNGTSPAAAPSEAARELARAAFLRGVELVEQRRFREAKQSFLDAHAAAPHPLALYNAALACVELGERREALELLERAISKADTLGEDERRTIQSKLDALRESIPEHPPAEAAREPARAHEPRSAAAVRPSAAASPRSERSIETARPPVPIERATAEPERDGSAGRATSYLVGGAGLTLLVASGVLYGWNDGRHGDWQKTNRVLEQLQDELVDRGEEPRENPTLQNEAAANDRLLASIRTFDVVNVLLFAVGVVGVGAGTWMYLDAGNAEPRVEIALGRYSEVRYRF